MSFDEELAVVIAKPLFWDARPGSYGYHWPQIASQIARHFGPLPALAWSALADIILQLDIERVKHRRACLLDASLPKISLFDDADRIPGTMWEALLATLNGEQGERLPA